MLRQAIAAIIGGDRKAVRRIDRSICPIPVMLTLERRPRAEQQRHAAQRHAYGPRGKIPAQQPQQRGRGHNSRRPPLSPVPGKDGARAQQVQIRRFPHQAGGKQQKHHRAAQHSARPDRGRHQHHHLRTDSQYQGEQRRPLLFHRGADGNIERAQQIASQHRQRIGRDAGRHLGTVPQQLRHLFRQPEPHGKRNDRQHGEHTVRHAPAARRTQQQPQRYRGEHQEVDREKRIPKQKGLPQLQDVILHHSQCAALNRRRRDRRAVGDRRGKQNARRACGRKQQRPQRLFREPLPADEPMLPNQQHGQPDRHHAGLLDRQTRERPEHCRRQPSPPAGKRIAQQHPIFQEERQRQNIVHRAGNPVHALPCQHGRQQEDAARAQHRDGDRPPPAVRRKPRQVERDRAE